MIDIHSHIIPGVDDGSETMEMTLSMMLRAYDQGVRTFFATPHSSAFGYREMDTRYAFWDLQAKAKEYFPDVRVYLGCEIKCEADRMSRVLKALKTGKYPTMNETPYILVEFSQWVTAEDAIACIKPLVKPGWKPIIAHMERYVYLQNNMDLVDQLRQMGCLIQVNAYSVQEEMDEEIKTWARSLVLNRKADFFGTDAHRTYHRPPSVRTGLDWLYASCDREYADAIAFGNAETLLIKPVENRKGGFA